MKPMVCSRIARLFWFGGGIVLGFLDQQIGKCEVAEVKKVGVDVQGALDRGARFAKRGERQGQMYNQEGTTFTLLAAQTIIFSQKPDFSL